MDVGKRKCVQTLRDVLDDSRERSERESGRGEGKRRDEREWEVGGRMEKEEMRKGVDMKVIERLYGGWRVGRRKGKV